MLELVAAVTGNRFKYEILKEHKVKSRFMWSDSTTIRYPIDLIKHWKAAKLVANRYAKVPHTSTVDDWHHVSRKYDPSDLGNRGIGFDENVEDDFIKGPIWPREPITIDQDNLVPALQEAIEQFFVAKAHKSVSTTN